MSDRNIEKYLRLYAEDREPAALEPGPRFSSAVVVPFCAEAPETLLSWLVPFRESQAPRLLIVVVNQRQGAEPEITAANQGFLSELRRQARGPLPDRPGVAWLSDESAHPDARLLLLTRVEGELAFGKKEGVGRARKLGFDWALRLHAADRLASPWVGSGDADAPWGLTELAQLEEDDTEHSAWLLPYTHAPCGDVELDAPMAALELTFRYYVLGLAFAGSPYAYHALGSALAVRLDAYAAARGFPNRQAGEDFYLLAKLAKLRPLRRRTGGAIRINTRLSARVPFGTGPALASCHERARGHGGDASHGALTYDPRVFVALRQWLGYLRQEAGVAAREPTAAWLPLARTEPFAAAPLPSVVSRRVEQEARSYLAERRAELVSCPSPAHKLRRLHEHWDALATLRFVHALTNDYFPRLPVREALARADLGARDEDAGLVAQRLGAYEAALPTCIGPARSS